VWEAQRRNRLSRPNFIKIDVDAPSVELSSPNNATVVFTQRHESDRFSDRVVKTMEFAVTDGRCLIMREITIE